MYYGEQINLLGNGFRLLFIENEGMAWGWKLGGDGGKLILTVFRLVAVILGVFYIKKLLRKENHPGFLVCVALIFAGAFGNLIDSMFYGLIFSPSEHGYPIAQLFPHGGGYGSFLHGKVVDMIYCPIIDTTWPSWMPFVGGERLTFFDPVFNIADASISSGVIAILVFQKKFFKSSQPSQQEQPTHQTVQE